MARPLRIEFPGAVYHVTSRGNAREAIYLTQNDRKLFLKILEDTVEKFNWICHAYCLLTNHYHLLIETPDGNLSRGMRQLNGVYTQSFNRRHNRVGHVFQGRFKAVLVQKDTHLLELCRYIVLNPVRGGIADTPADYEWSSYRATVGQDQKAGCLFTDWLLSQFGDTREKSRRAYKRFVLAGMDREVGMDRGGPIIGDEGFIESLKPLFFQKSALSEVQKHQKYIHRPSLERLFSKLEKKEKEKRNRAIVQAYKQHGYTQQEIAGYLGLHYSWVSRIIAREGKRTKSKT
jgi:putative transposase